LLGGASGVGGLVANGLLIFLVSSSIFVLFGYVWTSRSDTPPDSQP
jgi:hypothetical protein